MFSHNSFKNLDQRTSCYGCSFPAVKKVKLENWIETPEVAVLIPTKGYVNVLLASVCVALLEEHTNIYMTSRWKALSLKFIMSIHNMVALVLFFLNICINREIILFKITKK